MDKRIGAQLYTVRDFCKTKEALEETLAKIADIGYKVVQISGIGPIPAEDVKECCDKYGLEIACTHRSFDDYKNNAAEMIKYHQTLKTKVAGLGFMPKELRCDKATLLDTISKMNEFYDIMAAEGLTFAYHNHAFEFSRLDGKYVMDYFIEKGKFKFIVDTYWLAFAGIDPAEFIEKLGDRVAEIHFKDLAMHSDNTQVMAEIGAGNLDWDKIIPACGKAAFALVEQDVCERDPFESLKMSYDFLVKKGFE